MSEAKNRSRINAGDKPQQVVLVAPGGAINPRTGGGQRTSIFFQALLGVAPVSVVVLGLPKKHQAHEFFPGAREVIGLPHQSFSANRSKNRFARMLKGGLRVLTPQRTFHPLPDLVHSLSEAIGNPTDTLFVYRYLKTFANAEVKTEDRIRVAVDIDDRDDLKAATQLRATLGSVAGNWANRLLGPRIHETIVKRVDSVSLLWFAKPEDQFELKMPPQFVVPNVPFTQQLTHDASPKTLGKELLFVGSSGHSPNQKAVEWFLTNCWPIIQEKEPESRFRVVGLGDWNAVLRKFDKCPGLKVVGQVQDLSQEYSRAVAAVCPIQEGAGSQIKVIEACGFAKPVVATDLAASGFGEEIRTAIDPTNSPESFAARCLHYLQDHDAAKAKGLALQSLQQQNFSLASAIRTIQENVGRLYLDHPRSDQTPAANHQDVVRTSKI